MRLEAARLEAQRRELARQEALAAEQRQAAQVQVPEKQPNVVVEKPRKLTLLGRPDRDERLAVFAEVWSQRVQQNADFEILNGAKNGPYDNPIVTVTLRVDGNVESVVFKRSSGSPAIDEAVRKVVMSLAPYSKLPAELAMDYDLIEVSRLWTFGSGLRLLKTGR
jgi:outer membrane biosynthesis protein TonB